MAYPAKVDVKWARNGSRLELFIRFLYGWILSIAISIWGFFVFFAWIVQWIYIFAMGRRQKDLNDFMLGFWRFNSRANAYILMLTDSRTPITGKRL